MFFNKEHEIVIIYALISFKKIIWLKELLDNNILIIQPGANQ